MDLIINTVYSNTLWLYKVIYSNKLFFIDFWTFNHIWSGAFIYLILKAKNVSRVWLVLIILLLTYELIEIMFRIFALDLFKPEIIKDQINDVIFGIFGAILCRFLLKIRKSRSWDVFHLRYPLTSLFTSGTISYLAVGFSYRQNLVQDNGVIYVLCHFIFLWFALYYLLQFYEMFKAKGYGELKSKMAAIGIFWAMYVLIMLAVDTLASSKEGATSIYFTQKPYTAIEIVLYAILPIICIVFYKMIKMLVVKADGV